MTSTTNKANKLDLEEQTKIKRLGIEMQLLTSEIEEKADRWNEPQNEIVKVKIIEIVGFKYLFYCSVFPVGKNYVRHDLFNSFVY